MTAHALDAAFPRSSELARADAETRATALSVSTLSLRYGDRLAVDCVSLELAPGSVLALLGPSGSGKSSVLRMIAGLEMPTAGTVAIDGHTVAGNGVFVEPERRQVGMVFQDLALFPHLTVHENVAFGIRSMPRTERDARVLGLLDGVGLADRAGSYPHMLSGGERQRIALARALAPRPRILLMDEPFSSLDSRLREQVRDQTMRLLRRERITTVIVTHDPAEAMRVADRVGVLDHGTLVQFGTPSEIYRRPCSPRLARSLGAVNAIEGAVECGHVRTPIGVFRAPSSTPSGPAIVCVRPQHVALSHDGPGVRGIVTEIACVGDCDEVRLRVADVDVVARAPIADAFAVGDGLQVFFDPSHVLVFPRDGARASLSR